MNNRLVYTSLFCYNNLGDNMEKQTTYNVDENGVYSETTVTTVTPQDGFVPQSEINKVDINNYGKYKMGYSKSVSYSTNDPKVTIPFLIIMCGIFQLIIIVILLVGISNGALDNSSLMVFDLILFAFLIGITIAEVKEIKRIKDKFRNK